MKPNVTVMFLGERNATPLSALIYASKSAVHAPTLVGMFAQVSIGAQMFAQVAPGTQMFAQVSQEITKYHQVLECDFEIKMKRKHIWFYFLIKG